MCRPWRTDGSALTSEVAAASGRSMARGFESKDVEFQQAEAERAKTLRRALTADERAALARRRSIELALARARADLTHARTDAAC